MHQHDSQIEQLTAGRFAQDAEFAKAVDSPGIRDFFATQGATPITSTPEEFSAHIRAEVVKLGKMVRDSGAKAD